MFRECTRTKTKKKRFTIGSWSLTRPLRPNSVRTGIVMPVVTVLGAGSVEVKLNEVVDSLDRAITKHKPGNQRRQCAV